MAAIVNAPAGSHYVFRFVSFISSLTIFRLDEQDICANRHWLVRQIGLFSRLPVLLLLCSRPMIACFAFSAYHVAMCGFFFLRFVVILLFKSTTAIFDIILVSVLPLRRRINSDCKHTTRNASKRTEIVIAT
jgi:hypothetical protein